MHFPPQTFGGPFRNLANLQIATVTASGDCPPAADIVECENSSDITIDLPPAANMLGRAIIFRKIGNNTATVVLDPSGSETIERASTLTLFVRDDCVTAYSNGTEYLLMTDARYKHACQIRAETTKTIANNTTTAIDFDVADVDVTGAMADLANERIVIARAGFYQITSQVTIPGIDTGEQAQARISVNGSLIKSTTVFSPATDTRLQVLCEVTVNLDAGDLVTLGTYQNSGDPQDTTVNVPDNQPFLAVLEL